SQQSDVIEHPGGMVELGHRDGGFAFDNESPRHSVLLTPFTLEARPVTCGDWMEFIDDGGYRRPELWLSDGWATVNAESWQAPLYWYWIDDRWWCFTLGGSRHVNPAEPVCHVSYYEADAFARWVGARLPTEAEWETLSETASAGTSAGEDGRGNLADASNFLDTTVLHPRPVASSSPFFGDVWQWTSSSYAPYPGFKPAAGAVGEYNGKFMVNQYVLRGGSCVTPVGHVRGTYRNFFPPAARWAFSGLRVARDD
ncbi:MAG: SUMF1/EgtB/PvdO family nonheme iron enzyme, partial [Acidimicrobiales bacterium]